MVITSSRSCTNRLSRVMPAFAIRMSTWPIAASAAGTSASTSISISFDDQEHSGDELGNPQMSFDGASKYVFTLRDPDASVKAAAESAMREVVGKSDLQPILTTGRGQVQDAMVGGPKEIADRLYVSVRTVEGHVYRACAKLDVADRVELAELIRGGH